MDHVLLDILNVNLLQTNCSCFRYNTIINVNVVNRFQKSSLLLNFAMFCPKNAQHLRHQISNILSRQKTCVSHIDF